MLEIKDLKVEVEKKIVLENFNLKVSKNEIHLIMGPNGSGKSSFTKALSGHPLFKVKKGSIKFLKKDLLKEEISKRAKEGIFVSFQYPLEIENISNLDFLFEMYNLRNKKIEKEKFKKLLKRKMKILKMDEKLLKRGFNEGFSGGEKKKNEIIQMEFFSSKLIVLDEIDSGLDIDSLKIISQRIKKIKEGRGIILISHYLNLLKYIDIDFVHILKNGKIVKTGKRELCKIIKEKGYKDFL